MPTNHAKGKIPAIAPIQIQFPGLALHKQTPANNVAKAGSQPRQGESFVTIVDEADTESSAVVVAAASIVAAEEVLPAAEESAEARTEFDRRRDADMQNSIRE